MNTKQMRESIVMAKELDVAGEFVYAALEKINKIDTYEEVSDIFFILYHLSVGIERLQKILLVVLNDVELNKIQDFLENIKIHSHKKLHNQISNHIEISFSSAQNALLAVLAEFYTVERYGRFDFFAYNYNDEKLLTNYIKKYCPDVPETYNPGHPVLINTDDIKDFLGKTIGRLCQKYYNVIKDIAPSKGIFAYELRPDSAAERIFVWDDERCSYQKIMKKEKRAIKELLIYLRNQDYGNKLLEHIGTITPLPFDSDAIQGYVADLCNKTVSIDLINEVDFMHKELGKERFERELQVDLIGDRYVSLDFDEDEWT